MSPEQTSPPPSPSTAAEWFARMQGPHSSEDARGFARWLADDPAREDAYRRLESRWAELGLTAGDRRVMTLKAQVFARASRSRMEGRLRIVAAVVLVIGLSIGMGSWWHVRTAPLVYETGAGERLNLQLADRSQVDLAPHTRLRVRLRGDERRLESESGQAYFNVAHEPRPFRVYAADRIVTALGTQFQVRIDGGAADVLLVEGSVTVAPSKAAATPPQVLKPRQRLEGPLVTARPTPSDVEVETAWRIGRLVFRERPLSEVVQEFNRWSTVPIEIGDPGVAGTRISGSFRYDGAEDFIQALTSGFNLSVETRPDGRKVITGPA